MQTVRLTASIALGLGVFLSVPSWAVIVDPVRGDVTINQGDGFRRVTGTMQANIGDAVMVGPGDSAWIVYDDTCVVEVKPGSVVTITAPSPCGPSSDTTPAQFEVGGAIAAGVAGAGAVVGTILLLLNNKNNDKLASP